MTASRRAGCALAALLVAGGLGAGDRTRAEARALPPAPAPAAADPAAAALPRFARFGWVSPPRESTTAARYAELANAGLDVTVLAWGDSGRVADNLARLAYTRPWGVTDLLFDARLDHVDPFDTTTWSALDTIVTAYRDDPAFLGWYLGDEPDSGQFDRLGALVRALHTRDPGHPGWNNLLGRNAFPSRDAWLAYVRDYVARVRPTVLCDDEYDFLAAGDRDLFVENVAGLAEVAREHGLPFWGVVLLVQHGPYRAVSEGMLRWEVAQWLAYGARGVGYFTYWTPAPDSTLHWGPAMIAWGTGERTPAYDVVRRLNADAAPVGGTLAGLAWLATAHAGFLPRGGTAFAPDSLLASVAGRCAIGCFADSAGAPYLLVANSDSLAAQSIALELVGERTAARLLANGGWQPLAGAPTPRGRRVTLDLAPGDFALLRVSGSCDGVVAGHCPFALGVTPNPARGGVRFAATDLVGPARLTVLDVGGRAVWSQVVTPAAPIATWGGTLGSGGRARAGVYFARLADTRSAVVRRVAWLGAP